MPTTKNANQSNKVNRSSIKSVRKAPGTRLGTVQDWRVANSSSGNTAGRHGQTIRDGR